MKEQASQQRSAHRTLWGLVIHAAADGIAAGSASLSNNVGLSATVSLAILLHKFPVAFALSTYLRQSHHNIKGWDLTRSMLLFSLSSPIFLLATFFIIGELVAFDQALISLVILFSGGTVAYAAFLHVLPSTLSLHSNSRDKDQRMPAWVVVATLLSSFIPLLLVATLPED